MDDIDRAQEYAEQYLAQAITAHNAKRSAAAVSAVECHDCGDEIPEQRRKLARGCTRCLACQKEYEGS